VDKATAHKHIQQNLDRGDKLVGFFYAIQPVKFWLFLLIGPLAFLSMKSYFVAATESGLTFYKLNMLGKFAHRDHFPYNEIGSVKIGSGLLQRPMGFVFKNGRKFKLKAQWRGVDKVAKLTEDMLAYLERRIPAAKK